jgi:hypothetical protein
MPKERENEFAVYQLKRHFVSTAFRQAQITLLAKSAQ